jgi:hypothetical protein
VHKAIDRTAGAKRIAAAFNSAGGPPAAADALEELLSASGHTSESVPSERAE